MPRGTKYHDRESHNVTLNLQSFDGSTFFLTVGDDGVLYVNSTEPTNNTTVEDGTAVGSQS